MAMQREVSKVRELSACDETGNYLTVHEYQVAFRDDHRRQFGKGFYTTDDGREITRFRRDGNTFVVLEIAPYSAELWRDGLENKTDESSSGQSPPRGAI